MTGHSPVSLRQTLPDPARPWRVGTLTYSTGGLVILFLWLLWGDFAWSMRDRSIPPIVQLLLKQYGASDTLAGFFIASLPAGIGMIIGPIIGYRSDRHRGRWGRRIPFLLVPTPFIVLSLVGLAYSPQIGSALQPYLPVHAALTVTILFWTTFEIFCIVANSVFGALINDVVPQRVLGRFFGLFRGCSLLAGIATNYWIMGKAETHFAPICLGIGLLYGFGFTLMCLKVKESAYPPPPPVPSSKAARGGLRAAVGTYFKDCLGHPFYRLFFFVTIVGNAAPLAFNVYSIFFAKSIGLELDAYFKCIAASYFISLCLAYPLGMLADRFHPLVVSLVVIALYGVAMLGAAILVKGAFSFGIAVVVHTVLSGTFGTVSASLNQRLLPRAKFAEIASAGDVLKSLAFLTLPLAMGVFLDLSGHVYHYLFYVAFGLSALAVSAGTILHRQFLILGGPENYRAPER